jgi:hypothetical protein
MKGLLAFIAIVGIIVIGVGLSRGWFSVNKEKIREDPAVIQAKEKAHELKADINKELNTNKQQEVPAK